MKHIKLFEEFNSSYGLNEQEIEDWLLTHDIYKYKINNDGTVDIDGDVNLFNKQINIIPIKFGLVSGNFLLTNNNLESLKGCPNIVQGNFKCISNKIKTLEGSPIEVGGNYSCSFNSELESTYGMPLEIGKDFKCFGNPKLKELDSVSNIGGYIIHSGINVDTFEGECKGFKLTNY